MTANIAVMLSDGERRIIHSALELANAITMELAFGYDRQLWKMLDQLVHVTRRCFDGTGEVDVRTVQCLYANVKHEYNERCKGGKQ